MRRGEEKGRTRRAGLYGPRNIDAAIAKDLKSMIMSINATRFRFVYIRNSFVATRSALKDANQS